MTVTELYPRPLTDPDRCPVCDAPTTSRTHAACEVATEVGDTALRVATALGRPAMAGALVRVAWDTMREHRP